VSYNTPSTRNAACRTSFSCYTSLPFFAAALFAMLIPPHSSRIPRADCPAVRLRVQRQWRSPQHS
jgi:hypothetical protein